MRNYTIFPEPVLGSVG